MPNNSPRRKPGAIVREPGRRRGEVRHRFLLWALFTLAAESCVHQRVAPEPPCAPQPCRKRAPVRELVQHQSKRA
jgi:hypothetical protein